uniref:ANK_REP_REGION domain-containing protein n=1 Tax=Meloidogyne javanica TaxID=6303 RepID=A0A915MG03_MELJA
MDELTGLFLTAAEEGDFAKLQQMYASNPELLMAQDRDGYTALHRAAYNDRIQICKWLLEKGADPEIRTCDGWTALHCAAFWANYEVVAILLKHGKIVPLHLAINSSSEDKHKQYLTVKYLLEAPGVEMNAVNGAGDSLLDLAKRTRSDILELLKIRRVIIDSDEEENETVAEQAPNDVTENIKQLNTNEIDEIVSEMDVYLLPVEGSRSFDSDDQSNGNIVSLNRLQFPQQHTNWLERIFNSEKCQAYYKAQVKHLRLRFGEEEQIFDESRGGIVSNSKGGSGGIADLLRPKSELNPSTSNTNVDGKSSGEVFMGEGFSQHEIISHAVGLFKEGKLFLLPVEKTYEMRRPLAGTIEKEASKAATQKEASSSQKISSASSGSNLAPLRVKYTRAENDVQRRRREQSSFYKQKLVEQDVWLPLSINKSKATEIYREEIDQIILKSGDKNECNSIEEQKDISSKSLLLI